MIKPNNCDRENEASILMNRGFVFHFLDERKGNPASHRLGCLFETAFPPEKPNNPKDNGNSDNDIDKIRVVVEIVDDRWPCFTKLCS